MIKGWKNSKEFGISAPSLVCMCCVHTDLIQDVLEWPKIHFPAIDAPRATKIATKKWYPRVRVPVSVSDWLNSQGSLSVALTGKGFSSTEDGKAPAPFPDSTVPKWPSAFPNALLQDSAAAEFGRCWSASVTPGRAERTLITAQVCLVCWVFWSSICHLQVGREVTAARFLQCLSCDRGVPWDAGALSSLSCKKGTWRCNYSSDSSFESFSGGSGFSLSVWDCTDAWSCLLWTTWSLPEQSYACFKDQGDRSCMVKAHWEFTFCDSQPSVLSILRWALSVTEDLLMCF